MFFYKEVYKYNQNIKWIIKTPLGYVTYEANLSICLFYFIMSHIWVLKSLPGNESPYETTEDTSSAGPFP